MRDLDLRARHDGVDGRLAELALDRALLGLLDALLDLRAQLVEGVVPACLDREVVVELGQPLLLDLLDVDGEDGVLAGQVLGLVVVGEGDLDLALLAGRDAAQLLLEARDQPAGAELGDVTARVAARELLAVDPADEVHHDEVTVGRVPLHRLERGERLAQAVELRLHLVRACQRLPAPDLDALVLAEPRGRHHADLEGERER